MAHTLTTPITIQNITRIIALRPEPNDDIGIMAVPLEIRTTSGSDLVIGRKVVVVRNGMSDRIVRATPVAGMAAEDLVAVQTSAVNTPAGFTAAMNAWTGGGVSAGNKRIALEDTLRTLGVIDPVTLQGA